MLRMSEEAARALVSGSPCVPRGFSCQGAFLGAVLGQVWVVNKTGVSLAYRAAEPPRERNEDHDDVLVRQPGGATYRTDADTMLFSRYVAAGREGGPKNFYACGGLMCNRMPSCTPLLTFPNITSSLSNDS